MYPGVPEVSQEFSGFQILATPKSVIRIYPLLSKTRFSGFKSRWMIPLLCKNSSPRMIQAAKNSESKYKYWLALHWSCYFWLNESADLLHWQGPWLNINFLCLGRKTRHLSETNLLNILASWVNSWLIPRFFWIKLRISEKVPRLRHFLERI